MRVSYVSIYFSVHSICTTYFVRNAPHIAFKLLATVVNVCFCTNYFPNMIFFIVTFTNWPPIYNNKFCQKFLQVKFVFAI
jgi:hypothetical protein